MINKKRIKLGYISALAAFILYGCGLNNERETVINAKIFSVRCSGVTCQLDTANAYRGHIIVNLQDTIFYSLGYIESSLSDRVPEVVYFPPVFENVATGDTDVRHSMIETTNTNIVIVRRKDYDIDIYRKQNLQFKKDRGYTIKYTFPIDTLKGGMVGAYYDSVASTELGTLRFTVFLKNPHIGNYAKCRDVINQITIHRFDSTGLPLPAGTRYIE